MAKPEWGTKRTGPCGTKFYDFNKSPIICPGCGGEVITHDVKINNKNELDKNPRNNSKEQFKKFATSVNGDDSNFKMPLEKIFLQTDNT